MGKPFYAYEASVKLTNGKVVTYHNINTGLFKFHEMICLKFKDEPNKWINYSVRRITTQEIMSTYHNDIHGKTFDVISIYAHVSQRIEVGQTWALFFKFKINDFMRNNKIFIAKKMILENTSDYITIPLWLYQNAVLQAKNNLSIYYQVKSENILDICPFETKQSIRETKLIPATYPTIDRP